MSFLGPNHDIDVEVVWLSGITWGLNCIAIFGHSAHHSLVSHIFPFCQVLGQLGSNIFPVTFVSQSSWILNTTLLCNKFLLLQPSLFGENGCSSLYSGFGQASSIPGSITLPFFKFYLIWNLIISMSCSVTSLKSILYFPILSLYTRTHIHVLLMYQQNILYIKTSLYRWFPMK